MNDVYEKFAYDYDEFGSIEEYLGAEKAFFEELFQIYENSGFVLSHRMENYFLEHYDKPIFEHGVQLKDKVYLKRGLHELEIKHGRS